MIVWLFLVCVEVNGDMRCEQITVKSEATCEALRIKTTSGECKPVKLWSEYA